MQLTDYTGIAGLYTRLSRDDGTDSESNSIANHKRLLAQKAKELGFTNIKFYVDDGYTGTNFNRPGFQAMLEDIEMGYVTTVMVKDLSRLGRDYVSVGHYTDNFFPEHNIRFIAVNDLVAVMYEKLFEKHINGVVNEESFMQLSQKYETERDELKLKIRQHQEELSEIENLRTSKEQFTSAVRKFMQMETLTPALLNELIEKIEVHSIEGKGKNKTQKIIIHSRFVGVIDNPVKEENIILEARQGVAVEYLTA